MKKAMILLAVICYLLAIGAFIEGIYKGIYINGIIVASITWWLADNFRKEAKRYE
jgi:hypothetical protein